MLLLCILLMSCKERVHLESRSHVQHVEVAYVHRAYCMTHLEEGIDWGGLGAIHINLLHEKALEALPQGKLLDFIAVAGLLVQKLITASSSNQSEQIITAFCSAR